MKHAQAAFAADDILAQADIILPAQYFAAMGSSGLSGEQRLMLAVLADAINVLQSWRGGNNVRKRRNFAEAAQWVNTRGTSHPFAFDSVCDALSVDPELVRARLRGLTIRPATAAQRPALGRLRLKELSRSQHMTANRMRRRERVPHAKAVLGSPSEGLPPWSGHAEHAQAEHVPDWTATTGAALAALGEGPAEGATGPSVGD